MTEESKIRIHIGCPPLVYTLDVGVDFSKNFEKLRTFVRKNNEAIWTLADQVSKSNTSKQIQFKKEALRLPAWLEKTKPQVDESIALVIYFSGTSLTVNEITELVGSKIRIVKLKNISKYLTSKNSSLFGYTTYDVAIRKYGLNSYGIKWVETQLIEKLKKSADTAGETKIKNIASLKKSTESIAEPHLEI